MLTLLAGVLLAIAGVEGGGRRAEGGGRRGEGGGRRGGGAGRREERVYRPLVPQLLPNYSAPALPPAGEVSCAFASLTCNYRAGCGSALHQYREACADLVEGATTSCSLPCRHALIGLISTVEGERLMECTCSDGPCTQEKARVEPCRAEVTWQTAPDSVVGCAAAAWICHASPACSKALDYYHANCQELFAGERCSSSCRNSVEILARQAAAAKLATCTCTGGEAWACTAIRKHTDTLCFGREEEEKEVKVVEVVGKEMGMEVGNEAEEVNRDRELWKGEVGLSARLLCVLVITVLGETVRTFVENLKL